MLPHRLIITTFRKYLNELFCRNASPYFVKNKSSYQTLLATRFEDCGRHWRSSIASGHQVRKYLQHISITNSVGSGVSSIQHLEGVNCNLQCSLLFVSRCPLGREGTCVQDSVVTNDIGYSIVTSIILVWTRKECGKYTDMSGSDKIRWHVSTLWRRLPHAGLSLTWGLWDIYPLLNTVTISDKEAVGTTNYNAND